MKKIILFLGVVVNLQIVCSIPKGIRLQDCFEVKTSLDEHKIEQRYGVSFKKAYCAVIIDTDIILARQLYCALALRHADLFSSRIFRDSTEVPSLKKMALYTCLKNQDSVLKPVRNGSIKVPESLLKDFKIPGGIINNILIAHRLKRHDNNLGAGFCAMLQNILPIVDLQELGGDFCGALEQLVVFEDLNETSLNDCFSMMNQLADNSLLPVAVHPELATALIKFAREKPEWQERCAALCGSFVNKHPELKTERKVALEGYVTDQKNKGHLFQDIFGFEVGEPGDLGDAIHE